MLHIAQITVFLAILMTPEWYLNSKRNNNKSNDSDGDDNGGRDASAVEWY